MRPNDNPDTWLSTADPFFAWLFERCGRSFWLYVPAIVVFGALGFVAFVLGMAWLLQLFDAHSWGPEAFAYSAAVLLGLVILSVVIPSLMHLIRR